MGLVLWVWSLGLRAWSLGFRGLVEVRRGASATLEWKAAWQITWNIEWKLGFWHVLPE